MSGPFNPWRTGEARRRESETARTERLRLERWAAAGCVPLKPAAKEAKP